MAKISKDRGAGEARGSRLVSLPCTVADGTPSGVVSMN